MESANKAEAERLLSIAEKLLQSRDLHGSKEFAVLAQETEPLLDGSDQIIAIADVLISSEDRIPNINLHNWYSILQLEPRSDDQDLIKQQYRRLALLLHPDKNKYPFADQAFRSVSDAWTVLSDPNKKPIYDKEVSLYLKVSDLGSSKLPVRRNKERESFWTGCPYCQVLYEYPKVYEECCLRCENCNRAFHGVKVQSLPPTVPGKDAYYCYWGSFPFGFMMGPTPGNADVGGGGGGNSTNWTPPVPPSFGVSGTGTMPDRVKSGGNSMNWSPPVPPSFSVDGLPGQGGVRTSGLGLDGGSGVGRGQGGQKKRGRPRKFPV